MKTNFYVPANFNAEELIAAIYPNGDTNIKPQKLYYICDCITSQAMSSKPDFNQKDNTGFYGLSAAYMQRVIVNYRAHIQFLISNNILICDNHFINGFKCRGYKFTNFYNEHNFKTVPIVKTLNFKIEKVKNTIQASNPIIKELNKSRSPIIKLLYSKKLKIDIEPAEKLIEQHWQQKQEEIYLKNKKKPLKLQQKTANNLLNRNVLLSLIQQINNKDFNTAIDTSGQRLHTPLTRLPKYLRCCLTYNSEQLIAYDLKNSQPYLALALLCNHKFYNNSRGKKNKLFINQLDNELYQLLRTHISTLKAITLQQYPQNIDNVYDTTLKSYISNVVNGKLYDLLVNEEEGTPEFSKKRDAIKKQFMELLFDAPKQTNRLMKVKRQYATPFKVFDIIKSIETGRFKKKRMSSVKNRAIRAAEIIHKDCVGIIKETPEISPKTHQKRYAEIDNGYTKLATLLQRLESYIILDVICKNLNKEYPEMPLFTIHDSIATTEKYLPILEKEMLIQFKYFIGELPKLKDEPWVIEKDTVANSPVQTYLRV